MGATRFLTVYSQEGVQEALKKGFCVGVTGTEKPETDKVTIPHTVKKVIADGKTIGYNINKIYK